MATAKIIGLSDVYMDVIRYISKEGETYAQGQTTYVFVQFAEGRDFGGMVGRSCVYGADTTYSGIDVSDYQGTIDFSQVKEAGVERVYMRVASGSDFVDTKWETN